MKKLSFKSYFSPKSTYFSRLYPKNYNNGFSFLVLLIVIGILGIIVASINTIFDPIGKLSREGDNRRKTDIAQIQKALETYYDDNGRYPSSKATGGTIDGGAWNTNWGNYMQLVPKDPQTDRSYYYWVDATNNFQRYRLYASLEQLDDPSLCKADGTACDGAISVGANCGTGFVCNYGVTSPNISP